MVFCRKRMVFSVKIASNWESTSGWRNETVLSTFRNFFRRALTILKECKIENVEMLWDSIKNVFQILISAVRAKSNLTFISLFKMECKWACDVLMLENTNSGRSLIPKEAYVLWCTLFTFKDKEMEKLINQRRL